MGKPSTVASMRTPIKNGLSNWREQLRTECRQKAKERRRDWVQRHRTKSSTSQVETQPELLHEMEQLIQVEYDLWKQQILETAPCISPEDFEDEDMQQALQDLQQQLLQEFAVELNQELDAIQHEEQQYIAALADEYEAQGDAMQQDGGVLCPICQRAHLVQLHGVIACPVDRFQLDVRAEGITLDNVRQRLAGTYVAHQQNSCSQPLQFSLRPLLGNQSLFASCSSCGMLNIVV